MHAAAAQSEAEFTTNENGSFSFPNGLIRGQYRIIEVQAADGYENIYNSGSRARYFTVTDDNVTVNMYNPEKLSMTIKKTDMDGNPLDSFSFTLTNVADNTTLQADTGTDGEGTAVLTDIASGKYRLTESGSGYTSAYLTQYMNCLLYTSRISIVCRLRQEQRRKILFIPVRCQLQGSFHLCRN